jgi:two-component system, LytTR family, response regulator
MMIRTLLVDDEPLARAGLRARLRPHADIEIVGECGDGAEAVERIERLEPDLVFLDVQMPALNGFDVIAGLAGPVPCVVFVTAYDEYALEAFRVHAVDYLLKPVDERAFEIALDRVRNRLATGEPGDPLDGLQRLLRETLLEARNGDRRYLTRLFVREGERGFFIRTADLVWVQTADNYLRLAANGRQHLIRATMQELEQRLDPATFTRIHRRTLVNLELVQEVFVDYRGVYFVRMTDGTQHRLSRTFRERLLGRAI